MANTAQFILSIACVIMASWVMNAEQRLRKVECPLLGGEVRRVEMLGIPALFTLHENQCWKDGRNVWDK